MAISTYSELQTAVAQALRRPGDPIIVSIVANMIVLAETGIIYGIKATPSSPMDAPPVRIRAMETRDAAFAVTSEYTSLPSGFLEFKTPSIIATDPVTKIAMMPAEHMNDIGAGSENYASGGPLFAAIVANQLRLRPAPSSLTLDIVYYTLARLSDDNPTNALLTAAPNVYLFSACRETAKHLGDRDGAARWHDDYLGSVAAVQAADERGTYSISAPVMRVLGPTP